MIKNCKVCQKAIPVPQYGTLYWCIDCQQYHVCYSNGLVESETIKSDNYHLVFFPSDKEANVVEDKGSGQPAKIIKTMPMEELTHELAVHWIQKLKIYTVFQ